MNPQELLTDNLNDVQILAKRDLENLFEASGTEASKILVIDSSVDRFFFLSQLIDKHMAARYRIHRIIALERTISFEEQNNSDYYFLLRPRISLCVDLRQALEKAFKEKRLKKSLLHICFVPFSTIACIEILRRGNEKIEDISHIRIVNLDIDFLPVDKALLTMENFACFNELFISKDVTSIKVIARALLKLQKVYLNGFHNITAHGKTSCTILRSMQMMRHAFLNEDEDLEYSCEDRNEFFDSLLVVDRDLDPVSPLLSQKTYEGLLDAVFEINVGRVDLPCHIKDAKGVSYGMASLWNNADPIYDALRYLSFGEAGKLLNTLACDLQDEYNERKSIQEVSELRSFVKNLPVTQEKHRLSVMHTGILEVLAKEIRRRGMYRHFDMENLIACDRIDTEECWGYLSECMHRRLPIVQIFRIIFLLHYCSTSWDLHFWEKIKETLISAYGTFEVIQYIEVIEENGLFDHKKKDNTWRQWKKQSIQEINYSNQVEEEIANEESYVQSMIIGSFVDYIQYAVGNKLASHLFDMITQDHCQILSHTRPDNSPKVHVFGLCIVGGISLAEIESIRIFEKVFNKKNAMKIKILLLSTNLLNAKKFVQSIFGDDGNSL